jgi:hypothetical protein
VMPLVVGVVVQTEDAGGGEHIEAARWERPLHCISEGVGRLRR